MFSFWLEEGSACVRATVLAGIRLICSDENQCVPLVKPPWIHCSSEMSFQMAGDLQDSAQVFTAGCCAWEHCGMCVAPKIKGDLWVTLRVAPAEIVLGDRGPTVGQAGGWRRKVHDIKETLRNPQNIQKSWLLKIQNTIYLSQCDGLLGIAFCILCLTLYPNNDFKGVLKYCQYPLSIGKYDLWLQGS